MYPRHRAERDPLGDGQTTEPCRKDSRFSDLTCVTDLGWKLS